MPVPTFIAGQVLKASELNAAFASIGTPDASTLTGTTLASNVVNSSLTSVGTLVSGSIPATLLTGTVNTARLSGSYTGITAVGTLTGLTIGGAGSNRSITINAPTGYYAIQYFAINGTNEWHYEVPPSGSSWSLVESGVAERVRMDADKLYVFGQNANSPQLELGDWNQDGRYSALRSQYGYLLLGSTGVNGNIYLRTDAAPVGGGAVYIGGSNQNTVEVGSSSVVIAGTLTTTANSYGGVRFNSGVEVAGAYGGYYLFNRNTGSGNWALYADANTCRLYASNIGDMMTWENFGNYWIRQNRWQVPDANNTQWLGGVPAFGVNAMAGVGSYNFYNPSDERYKANRQPLSLGLSFLRRLTPIQFTYIYPEFTYTTDHDDADALVPVTTTEGQRLRAGLSAQEVKRALDAEGHGDFNFWSLADKDQPDSTQALDYTGLIAPLIQAVKELDSRLTVLET
jgi:hypothetical protein